MQNSYASPSPRPTADTNAISPSRNRGMYASYEKQPIQKQNKKTNSLPY